VFCIDPVLGVMLRCVQRWYASACSTRVTRRLRHAASVVRLRAQMSDAGMAYLGGHHSLTKLDLSGCHRLTDAGLTSVSRARLGRM